MGPFSTSASSAAVSMSTSELIARQRDLAVQLSNHRHKNDPRAMHPSQQHPQGISLTGMGQNLSQAPSVNNPTTQLYNPPSSTSAAAPKQRNQTSDLGNAIVV